MCRKPLQHDATDHDRKQGRQTQARKQIPYECGLFRKGVEGVEDAVCAGGEKERSQALSRGVDAPEGTPTDAAGARRKRRRPAQREEEF